MENAKIAAAFVKAQKNFAPALKTNTNPAFRSKYVALDGCIEAVIDSLNANGIALLQPTHDCESGVTVETIHAAACKVLRGRHRRLHQHHIGGVVNYGVREPVEEHVRLGRLGRAGEDHRRVVHRRQDLLRLDHVRDRLVHPRAGVRAWVVELPVLHCSLWNGRSVRGADALCRARDHVLHRVEEVLGIIKEVSKKRSEYVTPSVNVDSPIEATSTYPIEVEVGGATVFVLPVERFLHF